MTDKYNLKITLDDGMGASTWVIPQSGDISYTDVIAHLEAFLGSESYNIDRGEIPPPGVVPIKLDDVQM